MIKDKQLIIGSFILAFLFSILSLFPFALITLMISCLYFSWKHNEKTLKMYLYLCIAQTLFLIIFADKLSAGYNSMFSLIKEIMLYMTVGVTFIKFKIFAHKKFDKIDIALIIFCLFLLGEFIFGTTAILTRIMALRQLLIGLICYYFGKSLNITQVSLKSFERFIIRLCLIVAILGLIEYFMLGDQFWNAIPFDKYLANKGVESWINTEGVGGNFYTYDFVFIFGDKIRRLVSIFADPIVTGHVLFLGLMFLLHTQTAYKKIKVCIISLPIILTFSKGVYLLLAVTACIYLLKKLYQINKKYIYYILPLMLTFGAAFCIIMYFFSGNSSTFKHISGLLAGFQNLNLLGYGLGTSGSFVTTVADSVHNALSTESYIGTILTQIGLIGSILYGSFFFIVLIDLKEKYSIHKNYRIFLSGTLLIGIMIESFFSESSISSLGTGMYFIYIGLCANLYSSSCAIIDDKDGYNSIYIIGSKGIPANYGGFETFVDELVSRKKSSKIHYYVACMSDTDSTFEYKNAQCFNIKIPNIGPAKAVYYDLKALHKCIKYIEKKPIENIIVYVLACRIGPFFSYYVERLHDMGCKVFVNPDGHEWKRAKWNTAIRRYWKISEKLMVKHADLLICDSKNIEQYIQKDYEIYHPKTTFIAYGADTSLSELSDDDKKLNTWYKDKSINPFQYYLVVGRFVPENNYETMIKEFMKSDSEKDFVLITNIEKNKFYDELRVSTNFDNDKRIKFVGTVYDQQLLKKIRENAYGYLHGHEVGGTNPSLLEALATTDLNLLLDVGFNREVAENGALYWNKSTESLACLINQVEALSEQEKLQLSENAKKRIDTDYSWNYIVKKYEEVFERGA